MEENNHPPAGGPNTQPVQSSIQPEQPQPPQQPKFKLPILTGVIVAILLIVSGASAAYLFLNKKTEPVACTMEAKICPDGTAVSRTGPKCEFAPCPSSTISPTPDPTANWKTYTNTTVGFTIKYPPTFLSPKIPGGNTEGEADGTEDNGANVIFGNHEPIGRFTLVIKPYSKTLNDLSDEYIRAATYPVPGSLATSVKLLKNTSVDRVPAQLYTTIAGDTATAKTALFIGKDHAFTFEALNIQNAPEDVNLMIQILSTFKFTN